MMAFRPIPPVILAGLLFLPACAEGVAPPAPASELLTVEPAFLDLGSVTFGERRSGVFRVTNPGEEEVVISRIGPFSCSCASADLVLPDRGGAEARRRLDARPPEGVDTETRASTVDASVRRRCTVDADRGVERT